jgi:hypothetical protein
MPLPLPLLIRLLLRAPPPMRLPVQHLLRSRNTLRTWLITSPGGLPSGMFVRAVSFLD